MDQPSALLTCRSKIGKIENLMLSKEIHGRLKEIGLSFPTLDRTTTSSQIMISTPIDIAARLRRDIRSRRRRWDNQTGAPLPHVTTVDIVPRGPPAAYRGDGIRTGELQNGRKVNG
jgi:hypothetical protein